tara:strand:+ start:167 stop:364 length:198 start_codon:yes stop_codon:yes gene_type:complete
MKKLTLLLVFISIFGYAQTTTLPANQERLQQEFLDRMNPDALTPQVAKEKLQILMLAYSKEIKKN